MIEYLPDGLIIIVKIGDKIKTVEYSWQEIATMPGLKDIAERALKNGL